MLHDVCDSNVIFKNQWPDVGPMEHSRTNSVIRDSNVFYDNILDFVTFATCEIYTEFAGHLYDSSMILL